MMATAVLEPVETFGALCGEVREMSDPIVDMGNTPTMCANPGKQGGVRVDDHK